MHLKDRHLPLITLSGVVVLIIGVFISVSTLSQRQDQRSRASSNSVSFDKKSFLSVTAQNSSVTLSHTTGQGANRLLVVGTASMEAVSSATYNGLPLKKLARVDYAGPDAIDHSELWYMTDPPVGTYSVVVKFASRTWAGVGASTWFYVDPLAPFGNPVIKSGNSAKPVLTVPSSAGEIVIDSFSGWEGVNPITVGAGQTALWNVSQGECCQDIASSYKAGSSSTSLSYSLRYAGIYGWVAAAIKPALTESSPIPEPSATSIPTLEPTVVPTVLEPTVLPTAIPSPTTVPTTGSGATLLQFKLFLHGVGKGGDNVNPQGEGNANPNHPQRSVDVEVFNVSNQLVYTRVAGLSFDQTSGAFEGTLDAGGLETGAYTVKVKEKQYLKSLLPGIANVTKGNLNVMPSVSLVAGDVNNDNALNASDFALLMSCYGDLLVPVNCQPAVKDSADINDDGVTNQIDYNLFLRELTNLGGE